MWGQHPATVCGKIEAMSGNFGILSEHLKRAGIGTVLESMLLCDQIMYIQMYIYNIYNLILILNPVV